MLCQKCGALSEETVATACTPGELFRLLEEEAGALACGADHIHVPPPHPLLQRQAATC
jgi:hypothetical protein